MLIMVMTFDRYKAISAPLERSRWRTVKFAKILIGIVTFVGVTYTSHMLVFDLSFSLATGCQAKPPTWLDMTIYSLCRFAIDSILPFVLIFVSNILLLRSLSRRYEILREFTETVTNSTTASNGKEMESFRETKDEANVQDPCSKPNDKEATSKIDSLEAEMKTKKKVAGKKDTQLAVMLISVSFTFLFLMLPFLITMVLQYSVDYKHDPKLFADFSLAVQVSTQLMLTNACINFFLYSLTGSKFRADLKSLFCKK